MAVAALCGDVSADMISVVGVEERGSGVEFFQGNGVARSHAERSAHKSSGLGRIVVIEHRMFLLECILRGMHESFGRDLEAYSSVDEFERDPSASLATLIILSWSAPDGLELANGRASLKRLAIFAPDVPVVVLASRQDRELLGVALAGGVKGYIPMSMGFDLAVEAVRFVLAGGAYVPIELLMAAAEPISSVGEKNGVAMTGREMLVVRAIQQGKSNKIIAYELNMCESTVKVHVRHIMKKLGAKNRTAVAMKSDEVLGARAGFV